MHQLAYDVKQSHPKLPHFNGLEKHEIKVIKNYISKIVGNAILTDEEMCLLLVGIEDILNSCPLIQLSSQ